MTQPPPPPQFNNQPSRPSKPEHKPPTNVEATPPQPQSPPPYISPEQAYPPPYSAPAQPQPYQPYVAPGQAYPPPYSPPAQPQPYQPYVAPGQAYPPQNPAIAHQQPSSQMSVPQGGYAQPPTASNVYGYAPGQYHDPENLINPNLETLPPAKRVSNSRTYIKSLAIGFALFIAVLLCLSLAPTVAPVLILGYIIFAVAAFFKKGFSGSYKFASFAGRATPLIVLMLIAGSISANNARTLTPEEVIAEPIPEAVAPADPAPAAPEAEPDPVDPAPVAPEPAPVEPEPVEPPPAPEEPEPSCHPNYGGCLPIVDDLDCAGGNGNGPFTSDQVAVIGKDVYQLDGQGKKADGITCNG